MEDTTTAQEAALNPIQEPSTKPNGNPFWNGLLRTTLGITISIILTFGTNALVQRQRKAKDRKITAMMVMGNIETFADRLDRTATTLSWNDTLATYLLHIPIDSLDLYDKDVLLHYINNVTLFYTISHDKSAESIFSNSIETWKNLGSFEFIENVGQCFTDIHNIETIYEEFFSTTDHIRQRMMQDPDAYPGKTLPSKVLQDKEYRDHLAKIHSQGEYYHYLAAYLHWKNAKNMELMNVSEEELKQFIVENGKKERNKRPAPDQDKFRTPPINYDKLPDLEDWMKK